jgi:hypothetical protein
MEIAYARGREWSVFMEVAKWTVIDAVVVVKRKILYVSFGEGGLWVKMVTGKSVAPERVRP